MNNFELYRIAGCVLIALALIGALIVGRPSEPDSAASDTMYRRNEN